MFFDPDIMDAQINNPGWVKALEDYIARSASTANPFISPARKRPARRASAIIYQEFARALHQNSHILIMDEPATALSTRETDRLFELIKRLRDKDIAIIHISPLAPIAPPVARSGWKGNARRSASRWTRSTTASPI